MLLCFLTQARFQVVQVMLGGFGGSYKKAAFEGIGEMPGADPEGQWHGGVRWSLQRCGRALQGASPKLELATWSATSAMFCRRAGSSVTKHNRHSCTSFQTVWVAFGCYVSARWLGGCLVQAMKIMLSKDDIGGLEGVPAFLKALADRDMITLSSHGCAPQWIVRKEGQSMFLPAGFLATEHCKRGVLVYGIRKALLYTSQGPAERYNVVINLHEASKSLWAS